VDPYLDIKQGAQGRWVEGDEKYYFVYDNIENKKNKMTEEEVMRLLGPESETVQSRPGRSAKMWVGLGIHNNAFLLVEFNRESIADAADWGMRY